MRRKLILVPALMTTFYCAPVLAQQSVVAYTVDTDRSNVYVVTHRTGLLSFLGHEHAIVAKAWTSELCMSESYTKGWRGQITIQVDSLVVDSDAGRSLAGLGGGPGASSVAAIQLKMMDAAHLDASRFPDIVISANSVTRKPDGTLEALGTLKLHGVEKAVSIPLRVGSSPDGSTSIVGLLTILQLDYGIQPESIKGVIKVSNDVDLHFDLVARPTTTECR